MNRYDKVTTQLKNDVKTWLVTGCAGFIGSNLLETLLGLNQKVVGIDNFSTGDKKNLNEVRESVAPEQWARFKFIEGDIRDIAACRTATTNVDFVLHQAALGSVPRSLNDPATTNDVNISGFLNVLLAAKEAKVKSFTYAASSSTYGDHPGLPKIEDRIGKPLSPYAVTKYVNELYADVFSRNYGFSSIGLRYFNVFGKRQSTNGAYAAVIPKWTAAMIAQDHIIINGDGETSRDFCYIKNVIQANILAATAEKEDMNEIYNVAMGGRTTLNELFAWLREELHLNGVEYIRDPSYADFRVGDVRHSQADTTKICQRLGYLPYFDIRMGIKETTPWYVQNLGQLSQN